jgi:hypothetical protein
MSLRTFVVKLNCNLYKIASRKESKSKIASETFFKEEALVTY